MFKIIAVSNKSICPFNYIEQIKKIGYSKVSAIIIREKYMDDFEYKNLLENIYNTKIKKTKIIPHNHIKIVKELKIPYIHLSYKNFYENIGNLEYFNLVGVSVHSVSEAVFAEKNGSNYITCGHIFKTQCKENLAPLGTEFLKSVVSSVSIPVIAIGGINQFNINKIKETGANGACIMSEFMKSKQPLELLSLLNKALNNI